MKKILFLTRSYPDTLGSATIPCMHRVLNCVANSGKYEVHTLCMRYSGNAVEEKIDHVMVHRFNPSCVVIDIIRSYIFKKAKIDYLVDRLASKLPQL